MYSCQKTLQFVIDIFYISVMDKSDTKGNFTLCVFSDGIMTVRTSWIVFEEHEVFCLCPSASSGKVLRETVDPPDSWQSYPVHEILLYSGKCPTYYFCTPVKCCDNIYITYES